MRTAPLSPAALSASGTAPPAGAAILSTGVHLPDGIITNAHLEAMVDTSDTWILERTGIRERHRAGSGETASEMGAAAARQALHASGNPVPDVLIAATCSADTRLPATACLIQRQLGLTGMPAFDLNAACSGYVYGLALADSMIRSGAADHVLVVATEALTTLIDYGDRATCVLFGDAAGASVVGRSTDGAGLRAVQWGADGGEAHLIYYGPPRADPQGAEALRMSGTGTYRVAVERLCATAESLCAAAGWQPSDIDWLIPHQANARIIESAARRLGVSMDHVFLNVDSVGNTSAASVPLALHDAAQRGVLRPGQRVLSVAFGSGTTWGGFATEWTASASA